MKKPTLERGPKVSMPISDPQMMITSGVRQPKPDAGRVAPSIAAMSFPRIKFGLKIQPAQEHKPGPDWTED